MSATEHPDSETTFIDPTNPTVRHPFPSLATSPTVDLSVIIPAYNEEVRLPGMLDEALAYLQKRRAQSTKPSSPPPTVPTTPPFTYELIIVDDGSTDATADVAMGYVAKFTTEHVRFLRMAKNVGKGGAVRRGMMSARGRYVLMADADAATVFADLELLEGAVAAGSDAAIGSRAHLRTRSSNADSPDSRISVSEKRSNGRDALRSLASFVFNLFVVYVAGVSGLRDTQCGFKLFSRRAARVAFEGQHLSRWAFDVENMYRLQNVGLSVSEVPVRWTEVPGSKLSVVKATVNMVWDMLRMRYRYVTGAWIVSKAGL